MTCPAPPGERFLTLFPFFLTTIDMQDFTTSYLDHCSRASGWPVSHTSSQLEYTVAPLPNFLSKQQLHLAIPLPKNVPTNPYKWSQTRSGTAHYYNPQPSCYCLCSFSTWSFPSTWNALPHLLCQTKSQSFLISPTGSSAKVLQALLGSMKYRRKGWLWKAKQNPGTMPHPGTDVLVCVNLSK